uniref:(S)-ureidoglycine aminohydrolase n=1 Tax=Oryza punctata TaxID=4537 RepID=A0A0E0LKW1_ORYPU
MWHPSHQVGPTCQPPSTGAPPPPIEIIQYCSLTCGPEGLWGPHVSESAEDLHPAAAAHPLHTLSLVSPPPRKSPKKKKPTTASSFLHRRRAKMMLPRLHLLLVVVSALPLVSVAAGVGGEGFCSAEPSASRECSGARPPLYWKVTNPTLAPAHLQDLPGFTRSVYKRDHALITPESHVFSPLPDWVNTLGAFLISPAIGAHFTMYLAKMHDGSKSALPPKGVERLIFVLQGSILLSEESGNTHTLLVDSYAYLPANMKHSVISDEVTTLIIFERRYTTIEDYHPDLIVGSTDKQPLLETPGEVFELRKLLPTSLPYDFNIHIMDFQPGEYLSVKEVHYNQHGLLLLEGQGIYRLGDSWYPVQSGDTIWMAPFVPQWYAALGKTKTRYLLYKDVNRDPLM